MRVLTKLRNLTPALRRLDPCRYIAVTPKKRGVFEPDYLTSGGPEIPSYDALNVQMKGYDFPILENYEKFVHTVARKMGITVEECWGTPCKKLEVQTLKPQSTAVHAHYKLSLYERNVQVVDLPAPLSQIFFEVIQTALPEGVQLQIHEHEEYHEEIRYIPDLELKELKAQLETLQIKKH